MLLSNYSCGLTSSGGLGSSYFNKPVVVAKYRGPLSANSSSCDTATAVSSNNVCVVYFARLAVLLFQDTRILADVMFDDVV